MLKLVEVGAISEGLLSIGEWVGFLLVEKTGVFWAGGRSGNKQVSLEVWTVFGGI